MRSEKWTYYKQPNKKETTFRDSLFLLYRGRIASHTCLRNFAPTKCIIHFSFFTFHLKQVEGGAEEYIATIQSKLWGGTWIDKLVIVAIGLDVLFWV